MRASAERAQAVTELLGLLQAVRAGERALLAIDGFDGAGKTHLARELVAAATSGHGPTRPVFSVSIDGFHHPKARRVAAGEGAEGFYRGSYRYDVFRRCVVDPVRAGTPVTPSVWDVARDRPIEPDPVTLPHDAIVLVDGIFLQRPELADVWDATIWVDVPFSISVPRGNARFPGPHDADPEAASNQRYVGGQRLYLAEARPRESSTWIFENTDLARPKIRRGAR